MSKKNKTIQFRILQPTKEIYQQIDEVKHNTKIKTNSKLFLYLLNYALTNKKTAPPAYGNKNALSMLQRKSKRKEWEPKTGFKPA